MRPILRRLWHAFRHQRRDAELHEELEFHRTMKRREFEAAGYTPADAVHATARALGSGALARDHAYDVWYPSWLQGLGQDLRLAFRALASTRIVSAVAVLSLALGIGANTAIFSLVDSVLLRSLPVKDPQRLVSLSTPRVMEQGSNVAGWSYAIWEQLRRRTDLFDGAAVWSAQRFNLTRGGETAFVDGLLVNGSFFDTLGVPAMRGRVFTDADDRRGSGRDGAVAVISASFWRSRFGGAADVIGRTITLEDVPFTIIGITPPDFFGVEVGRAFDVALPIGDEPLVHGRSTWLDRGNFSWLRIIARLKPGDTITTAGARLRAAQPQIRGATLPALPPLPKAIQDSYLTGREGFALLPAAAGVSMLRQQYARPLIILLVAVGLVLLIACANIANLQLARAAARRQEISVRQALGASRWRLGRQVFTESAVLSAIGAALGVAIGSWTSRLLVRQLSAPTGPVFLDLSTDVQVLGFSVAAAITTALLFGVAPAVHASRSQPMEALKATDRRASGGAASTLSSGLVVAQVALSLVLVTAVGLFVGTFTSLASRDLGFKPDRVLLATIDAQHAGIDAGQAGPLYERAADAVRALPGVADAALSIMTPIQGGGLVDAIAVSGGAEVPKTILGGLGNAWGNVVSPGWFRTLGITLVAGRDFDDRDGQNVRHVAIVNQSLVRAFLDGQNPLGHTITSVPPQIPPMEIVGVVADSVYGSPREQPSPTVYTPLAQWDGSAALRMMGLSVRAGRGPASALTKTIAAAIGSINRDLSLTFRTLTDQVNASLMQERLIAMLSACLGALALLLAGVGLYGVMSYAVAQRRTELGIRLALGARPAAVVRLVLSRAIWLVMTGVAVGILVSLCASRFVVTLLYGLTPRDPATVASAALVLIGVAVSAAVRPAWRAARIDPVATLRSE
jgi:predicted permease